ncbi:MAG: lasso RiPP family leader peptide-containing protein [Methanobacterium sp.]|nr:lasso RiPP family leader peptide-containing protein [Methanobacterium sp.]
MKYEKPVLRKFGNLKEVTKGAWEGGNDGIPGRYADS